jgi:uncharacterized protein (TIGR00369 family)
MPTLADLMAVRVQTGEDDARVLHQRRDADLNNDIGIIHGGMASAGLELAASAAVNPDPGAGHLQTSSLRVNFMRPFMAGHAARYVGTPMRVGRSTGIADAVAIGDDGRVALKARLTAYR